MKLEDAQEIAEALLAQHGLAEGGWAFGFSRGKRTLGQCNYGRKRIELSMYFVDRNDEAEVRQTLLHEIAHALAGREAGHGPEWVKACQRIGARPERTAHGVSMPRGRFRAMCPGCGHEHHRHRRPMKGRKYYCRFCGPKAGRLTFSASGRSA